MPEIIFALRETPGRRSSKICPTNKTEQAMPMAAKVSSQGIPGGSGTSEGKSGTLDRSQESSHTFSTVRRNRPEARIQVRLSVSDFRLDGKATEAIGRPPLEGGPGETLNQGSDGLQFEIGDFGWKRACTGTNLFADGQGQGTYLREYRRIRTKIPQGLKPQIFTILPARAEAAPSQALFTRY